MGTRGRGKRCFVLTRPETASLIQKRTTKSAIEERELTQVKCYCSDLNRKIPRTLTHPTARPAGQTLTQTSFAQTRRCFSDLPVANSHYLVFVLMLQLHRRGMRLESVDAGDIKHHQNNASRHDVTHASNPNPDLKCLCLFYGVFV